MKVRWPRKHAPFHFRRKWSFTVLALLPVTREGKEACPVCQGDATGFVRQMGFQDVEWEMGRP